MKTLIQILITLFLVVMMIGCGDIFTGNVSTTTIESNATDTPAATTFPAALYGKWVYVDSGTEFELLSTSNETITKISDNLIKLDKNGTTYHLMRASINNTAVSGSIDGTFTPSVSRANIAGSLTSIGGISVILTNIKDKNIQATTTTLTDGTFNTSGIPSGDYTIKLDDGAGTTLQTEVRLEDASEDLGAFKLTGENLHNFKTELITSAKYIYADKTTYTGIIRVHNISQTVTATGLNYVLGITHDRLLTFNHDVVVGSILPQTYKDVPCSFSFDQLYQNERSATVNVTINDAYGNSWNDTIGMKLFKRKTTININTNSAAVKGYIVNPRNNKIEYIDIATGTIEVPALNDDVKYALVLSNPSLTDETRYSIGVNKAAATTAELNAFSNTSAHEYNGDETSANLIAHNTSELSYMHLGDLDYWLIGSDQNISVLNPTESTFTAQTGVLLGQTVTSNEINITSIATSATQAISVDVGTIVVNGSDVGSTATISGGDKVALKLSASSQNNTKITATLNLGYTSRTFEVTTKDSFLESSFTSQTNLLLGQLVTSDTIEIVSSTSGTATVDSGTIVKNGTDTNLTSTDFLLGDTLAVKVATSLLLNTSKTITLNLGYTTRTFTIKTISSAFETYFLTHSNALLGQSLISNELNISSIPSYESRNISVNKGSIIVNEVDEGNSTTIRGGDKVVLRLQASTSYNTTVTSTVDLVYTTRSFSVQSIASKLETEYFASSIGQTTNTELTSNAITIKSIDANTSVPVTINKGTLFINGIDTGTQSATVSGGQTVAIHTTTQASTNTIDAPTMTLFSDAHVWNISTYPLNPTILKTGQTVSYVTYDDGYYKKGLDKNFTRDATTGIVTDNLSGLQWQDGNISLSTMTYSDALTYCADLTFGGYSDWALPDYKESSSIMDWGNSAKRIETVFTNVNSASWSTKDGQTLAGGSSKFVFIIESSTLPITEALITALMNAHCVRGR